MEQLLKPERFDTDPSHVGAESKWKHWKRTFANFLGQVNKVSEDGKLQLLCNYVSANVFRYISDSENYSDAIKILDSLYITKRNEIFARHCLASRTQQTGESVDEYLQVLKQMSKDCEFQAVTADKYKDEYIRDSFIRGLKSSRIRERLLENTNVTLEKAHDQARSLELAELHSASYLNTADSTPVAAADHIEDSPEDTTTTSAALVRSEKCFFCGNKRHPRDSCPAKDIICRGCGKKGHYLKVCKSRFKHSSTNSTASTSFLASAVTAPLCLQKSMTKVLINGVELNALIDTGSSLSFLNERFVERCGIVVKPYSGKITMANSSLSSDVTGCGTLTLKIQTYTYANIKVLIMKNLCADFLIGHDLLKSHSSVEIEFHGEQTPLKICSLATARVPAASLFANLTPDCKPVITKSRRHTESDKIFIAAEVEKLLKEGVIEPSNSPWRAQVFVVKGENHKPRMVVDYSQTINKFTMLDAYPLPRIEELVRNVSQYKIFSTIDLKSAYHQVPILESDKPYTAFEAAGKLYQFRRIPFGVTNGVPAFQRNIDRIIKEEKLKGTFPYLDDVTVCGHDQQEHDQNLERFLGAVEKYNLTLNQDKCKYSTKSVKILGYLIEDRVIKPDPDRLAPLMNLPVPNDMPALQRTLGMFAHYCRWIPKFSEKIRPFLVKGPFPLSEEAVTTFNSLKKDVAEASLSAIEENTPFRVETDASEFAIGATLSQAERPIAFFSRTLNAAEQRHSSVEKEAYAIVESLRNWRHYLIGRHFEVITDQRSVAFMFDQYHSSKIKNEKIMRWRLELANYKFDIVYRPGNQNTTADTMSRITASTYLEGRMNLKELHDALCHPGVTRMHHWVRAKNLPYTLEEIKGVINSCTCCNELKRRFCRNEGQLIKATSPFERLSLDFKGPLPSSSKNRFLLTIVDEYSRFPFAFPCTDISASTVVRVLTMVFSLFGTPAYIHSDRGASFMSHELKSFLTSLGVATSRTTAYSPQGNGQVERYNGIIWKTVLLTLKSKGLKTEQWEEVLQSALHSIRSLLCTSTNATPHERMFTHPRRSFNGRSLPTWLTKPGQVLMKNHLRHSKYDPIVQEVELIEANPDYAYVKLPNGQESSVSIRHLAPRGDFPDKLDGPPLSPSIDSGELTSQNSSCDEETGQDKGIPNSSKSVSEQPKSPSPQKGSPRGRQRRLPAYLNDYIRY
ncbi:uncharacterized protein LOC124172088 [Ischnura elegans]|uniref:uncharacterized protein LOC124172088 n=1 Tax=Ischnura elegans TaxID=197161 RepID=UPI001ED8A3B5|nr:uncharacterized protein LOC124172088 [Ischnura elegans]